MEEVAAAHWTDLALRKKAGHGNVPHTFPEGPGIVMGTSEQAVPTSATTEDQRTQRPLLMRRAVGGQQDMKILTRGLGVAKMKLDRLPFPHDVANRHAAGGAIRADQVSHEEITPLEPVAVLVNEQTEMQSPVRTVLFLTA